MHEYRKRAYEAFVSKHWAYTHSLSLEEYELFRKYGQKKYKAFLPADKNANIVDIACGGGHFLYYLQKEGYINTKGIDISAEQLKVAEKMGVENVKQADLFEFLKDNPGQFDFIVANDIIEHFYKGEILSFLDHLRSALKPGGKAMIGTLNASSLFGANTAFIDFTHETGFTPESLMQVMRVCDFEDVKVYGEKPAVYDIKSAARAFLWATLANLLKIFMIIERGTGRNLWKTEYIFEPRIVGIGVRKQ